MERPAGDRRTAVGEKHRVSHGIVTCFRWRKNLRPRYRIGCHFLNAGFSIACCSYSMPSLEKKVEKEERVSHTECGIGLALFLKFKIICSGFTPLTLRNTHNQ